MLGEAEVVIGCYLRSVLQLGDGFACSCDIIVDNPFVCVSIILYATKQCIINKYTDNVAPAQMDDRTASTVTQRSSAFYVHFCTSSQGLSTFASGHYITQLRSQRSECSQSDLRHETYPTLLHRTFLHNSIQKTIHENTTANDRGGC